MSDLIKKRKRSSSEMLDGSIEDEDIEPSKIRQKINEISKLNKDELTKMNDKINSM